MKNSSRRLGLLLAVVLTISMIGTGAFAEQANLPKDINVDQWYCDAVNYVVDNGVMSLSDDNFDPLRDVELDDLNEALFKLEKVFNNLDQELKLEEWIAELELNKGAKLQDPGKINRAESAAVLYNYLKHHEIEVIEISLDDYVDKDKVPTWAEASFKYLVGGGIIQGKNGEFLAPKDNLNRSELAQLCFKLSNMLSNSTSGLVTEVSKYGNITIDLYTQNLLNSGFEYGDMLKIKIGSLELEAPFVTDYSDVDNGSLVVRAPNGIGTSNIIVAINMGNFAETHEVSEGDVVEFQLLEKGAYLAEWEIRQLERTNDRDDYDSDLVFANFRNVSTGDLAEGVYYRSSSPINNEIGRAAYVDALIKEAGIATVVNLADSEEEIKSYLEDEDFASPYYKELYEANKVILLNMGVDFKADDFKVKLKSGLEFLASNQGPFLVHCNEGKDRAGFVAGLLEALTGSSLEEIKEDYMETYINYYHIEKGSEQYNSIAESNILESLRYIAGLEKGASLEGVDLVKASEDYLLSIGLDKEQIEAIKTILSTEIGAEIENAA